MVTSLLGYTYTGDEGEAGGFPTFYTKENLLHDPQNGINLAAQLEGNVAIQSAAAHRPELSITPASPGTMRLRFTSQTGHSYQVQSRNNLTSGTWNNLGTAIGGTGNLLEYLDATAGAASQRFYRVVSIRTQP
jgi:hypothetical protein